MQKKTYSLPRRAEPTCIAKLPPPLGKGVGRRSPWKSLGKERKPSAKGVTPSVKGVTIRKWAYHLGKRGQLQQKKGQSSEQKGTEARRELTELCRDSTGLRQTKITKPPSKVTLSCPTAPLLLLGPAVDCRPRRALCCCFLSAHVLQCQEILLGRW